MGFSFSAISQKYTISGYISDLDTGEKLIGANVFDQSTGTGTVTNTYGFFSLTLNQDSIRLMISYIGYQSQEYNLYLDKNIQLSIDLSPSVELKEVEVIADEVSRIQDRTQMSTIDVPIRQIKKYLPCSER